MFAKRIGLVMVFVGVIAFGAAAEAANPQTVILTVDVGAGASIGMGPGGMAGSVMTGGGPVSFQGRPVGTMMHDTQTATMSGMMGQGQTMQIRTMSFDFPGVGTLFAMMSGGSPWTGAQGMILGGTGQLEGASGSVTVGAAAGPTTFPFTFSIVMP